MSKKYYNEIMFVTYLLVTSLILSLTIFVIIDRVPFELRKS